MALAPAVLKLSNLQVENQTEYQLHKVGFLNSSMPYLFAYIIWALDLSPFPSYGTLKFALHADSGRYLLADTSCPYKLPCEVGSLCTQGFRRYGGLKFTIGKAYLFNMKNGLEKSMENWQER